MKNNNTIFLDLDSLKQQFNALLAKDIPSPIIERTTFLEIVQMPHYEVIISRIYRFYLTDHAEHGLKDLFLRSLIQLVNESRENRKHTQTPFFATFPKEWAVEIEVSTKKGNRIDIWIDWLEEDVRRTIVVENKIFHFLRNDLEDYFNTPEGRQDDKIGILLTLGHQNPNHEHFINITHEQLLDRIRQNWGNYMQEADDRHLLFLKDFMFNITKLIKNLEKMHDFIEYYVDNRSQIEAIVASRNKFASNLLEAFVQAGKQMQWGALHKKADRYRSLQVDPKYDFKLTFLFDDGNQWKFPCYICLEIFGNLLQYKEVLRNHPFISQRGLNKHTWERAGYAYVADVGYDFCDMEKHDLVTYFTNNLEKTWKPVCEEVIEIIDKISG